MKKILVFFLILAMLCSLAGCAESVTPEPVDDPASHAADSTEQASDFIPEVELPKISPLAEKSKADDLLLINQTRINEGVFENGFTTGDKDLDTAIKQIIEENTSEENSFEDNLHDLYRHVRDNYKYRKMDLHDAENMGEWLFDNVRIMIEEGRGNCYSYAGLLYCLFRAYGFDEAEMCVGTYCKSPHGWVRAVIDGTEYIFDVETEYASLTRGRMPDHFVDCFWKTHEQLKAYSYHLEGAEQP